MRTAERHPLKLMVVSSVGGHLSEVMLVVSRLRAVDVILVVNDRCELPRHPFRAVYRISHAQRDWKVLKNFRECAAILHAERPDVVLSAGAGPAVPMLVLARLAGIRTVFVETAASVKTLSLTGRLLYPVVDHFFVQWPDVAKGRPRARQLRLVFP